MGKNYTQAYAEYMEEPYADPREAQPVYAEHMVAEETEWRPGNSGNAYAEYGPRPKTKGAGDPRFHALLKKIGELHDKKQEDYGTDGDPFANVRGSQDWGVAPWVGAMVRLNDKVHRLQEFARKGALANESAEDSMLDIMVYAGIALILYQEASKE